MKIVKYNREILQRIRREFSEKEKYNILMEDYYEMIRKLSLMDELKKKYDNLLLQHKNLQYRYSQLKKARKNNNK